MRQSIVRANCVILRYVVQQDCKRRKRSVEVQAQCALPVKVRMINAQGRLGCTRHYEQGSSESRLQIQS
jgi:hypothetical protein